MTEAQDPPFDSEEESDIEKAQAVAEEIFETESDAAPQMIKQQADEIARLKDQYLRAMAETENVRSRARRDIEDANKYAATKFARDVVSVVDNLQRASDSITAEARAGNDVLKQVGDGIDMTLKELLNIFERNGIRRINPQGEKFDHNLHQAMAQIPNSDVPPGHVAQVLQAGYSLHDRLLKPAMVTVSAQADSAA